MYHLSVRFYVTELNSTLIWNVMNSTAKTFSYASEKEKSAEEYIVAQHKYGGSGSQE